MMNEQLTSDELRQVLAEWIRPMYPKERRKIAGLFEAVIARTEAAEKRVAELEAQAAQGWRPVEEIPANTDVELRVIGGFRSDGYWYYHGPSKMRGWRPLPPTP